MKDILLPYEYSYLAGSLYFLGIWVLIFILRPKYRVKMVWFGLVFMGLGVLAEYLWWTRDWFHPITITGTRIGIEDFIMSFTHASIPVLIYKVVAGQKVKGEIEFKKKTIELFVKRLLILLLFSFFITVVMFYWFKFNSFWSTSVGMLIGGTFILLVRPDLKRPIFFSFILMIIISLPVYLIGNNIVSPGVIEKFWDPNISGIKFLKVPIEDIIWYGLLGYLMGGIYEYLFGFKLEKTVSRVENIKNKL